MADRNIADVIDEILEVLPPSHKADSPLKSLKGTAPYTAPEMMRYRWGQLAEILNDHMPTTEPLPDWAVQVGKIIRGER